jgi:hypothetical protein
MHHERSISKWPAAQAPLHQWPFPICRHAVEGPSLFQLSFFEDWNHPDATWAGFYFITSFCVSWALIVLESLRAYNLHNFGSWITIPGLLMFNHTPAIYLPLYLGVRLALMTPSNITSSDLAIDPVQLEVLPWAFAIGYVATFIVLLLPDIRICDTSIKQSTGWPTVKQCSNRPYRLFDCLNPAIGTV